MVLNDDEPALSESLAGLVGAFDRLRAEVGLVGVYLYSTGEVT
jgi:hypothetical protein